MKKTVIDKFCKLVGKRLQCTPATKQTLLQGLSEELSERWRPGSTSIADIEASMGTADQVAAELQSSVPLEEVQQTAAKERRKRMLIMGGAIAFALVLLLLALFIFMNGPFYTVETIEVYPS